MWSGEIQPATVEQIRQGRGGKTHLITADAGNVAQRLRELDSRLRLRYSEQGDYYVVYAQEPHEPEGAGHLVGTYQECDQRIVKDIEKTLWEWRQPDFSFADQLDKVEDAAEKEFDARQSEMIGDSAERLAHALRKDFGYDQSRVFIGKGLGGDED